MVERQRHQVMGFHGGTVYDHLHAEEDGYFEGEDNGRRIVSSLTEHGELILRAERIDVNSDSASRSSSP